MALKTSSAIPFLFGLLALSLLTACNGSDGGGTVDERNAVGGGSYDPTAGGFPALSQIPAVSQQLASCSSLISKQTGDLIGTVTYERRPMASNSGLLDVTEQHPARGVVVEAVAVNDGQCSQKVVATTLTDGNGEYAFELATDQKVCVQARAQLFSTRGGGSSGWDVQITDNTRKNAPFYLLDNSPDRVADRPVRDLFASSGWDGVSYSGPRAAAPFAILDSVCEVIDVMVNPANGLEKGQDLPPLKIRWSENNTPVSGDVAQGEIETAFYRQLMGVNELFLRGDSELNSDEYDPHVIVHEMAHYISQVFLRSDSLGGQHSLSVQLDPTTAFEEGWANAFAGIVLQGSMSGGNEVLFRDSLGTNGSSAGGFYLDSRASFEVQPGWYSEGSVHRIIYDLYDADNSYVDRLNIPLSEIYAALKAHSDTSALTTIYSFADALLDSGSVSETDLARLLLFQDIDGSGEYAVNESNTGDNPDALPVFTRLVEGSSQTLCSNDYAGSVNRIANYRYLHFEAASSRDYSFNLQVAGTGDERDGVATLDILEKGVFVQEPAIANGPGESMSLSYDLSRGSYVIALSHYDNVIPEGDKPGRKCFTISVN